MTRRRVRSGSPFEERIGFSRAVRVDDRVLVSGTAPIGADGRTVGAGDATGAGDAAVQARRCLEIIRDALAEAGARIDDVVRTRTYLTDAADWEAVGRVHGEFFGDARPASTMVVVAALLDPEWRVEIEAEAIVTER